MAQEQPELLLPYLLLDTNIILHLARHDALSVWLAAEYTLNGNKPAPLISVVTDGELRALALAFGWGAARHQVLTNLVAALTVVPLDYPGLLDAYARLDVASQRHGRKMGQNDLWIAATAHVTGATLLTTDKDFDSLHGLFLQRDWIDPATR